MPQWIGLAITVISMAFAGYKQFFPPQNLNNFTPTNLQIPNEPVELKQIAYCQINIAYDPAINKHYFQHLDGIWREYPPTP